MQIAFSSYHLKLSQIHGRICPHDKTQECPPTATQDHHYSTSMKLKIKASLTRADRQSTMSRVTFRMRTNFKMRGSRSRQRIKRSAIMRALNSRRMLCITRAVLIRIGRTRIGKATIRQVVKGLITFSFLNSQDNKLRTNFKIIGQI